jgi:hypothetical protein
VTLFGRKKTFDEAALEEARAHDALGVARKKPKKPSYPGVGASAALSARAEGRGKEDPDAHMLMLMQKVLAGRFHRPDPTLASAIEELRRKYAGRPPADVKPALTNALKGAGHEVPAIFLDTMASAVTGVHE